MGRTGTNNGGGARWHLMERATCPLCGLNRPVGVTQVERGYRCRNAVKCDQRLAKLQARGGKRRQAEEPK